MRYLGHIILFLLLIFSACGQSTHQHNSSSIESYYHALQLVKSVHTELGGSDHIKSLGGIYLRGEGMYDLSTRMQGKQPGVIEPYEIVEQLAVVPDSGQVIYESDTHVNPDARERIRYMYDGKNRMLFMDLYGGFAFWDSAPGLNDQRKRYSNMVPQLLLEEALKNRSTLKYIGKSPEGWDVISFDAPSYGSLTLLLNPDTNHLEGVEYLKDMPLLGDILVRWQFKNYKEFDGVGLYPSGYSVTIQNKLLKVINYTTVIGQADISDLFSIPDSIEIPVMPEPPTIEAQEAPISEDPVRDPVEVTENVYVFPNIRSGFHPMVIEFNEFLMAIDTPAGWFEMHQLPAMQWADEATSSSTGRRLLHAMQQQFPDKPVRYAALTHHHSDHAGGIRPFIAEGTAILASQVTAPVIEQAANNRFTLAPDELTGTDIKPTIEIVDGERTISDENMKVRLIDVGENPHANGMLVAYLPNQKILYQSDLFEPIPMHLFPSKSRIPVMKWFVNWLDSTGLDVDRVYSIHGSLRVTEEHLETIRKME